MQTSNAKQNFSSGDPVWILLAEFPLGDFLSDHVQSDSPTAGLLFQTARELGMSSERMESTAATLAGFAKETLARTKQGGLEFSGQIRIFCQKKMIDDASSTKTTRSYHTEQDKKQEQIFPDRRANRIGGWGYFTIERGENDSTGSTLSSGISVDLYLYKEGE
ncbi:MAG TPA: hypothetical protein VK897_24195 [Anaerolineales bacterium]|nr:hypothetical protein [Anaerolineales bacterium]